MINIYINIYLYFVFKYIFKIIIILLNKKMNKFLFFVIILLISYLQKICCVSKEDIVKCIDNHPKFQKNTCPDHKTKGMSKQDLHNYLGEIMDKKIFSILKKFRIIPNVDDIMKKCGNQKQNCITYDSTMQNDNCMPNWIEKKIIYEYFKCNAILKNK